MHLLYNHFINEYYFDYFFFLSVFSLCSFENRKANSGKNDMWLAAILRHFTISIVFIMHNSFSFFFCLFRWYITFDWIIFSFSREKYFRLTTQTITCATQFSCEKKKERKKRRRENSIINYFVCIVDDISIKMTQKTANEMRWEVYLVGLPV